MKVKIGRDFYDKKNGVIYTGGEVADVKREVALWMVRHSLAHIIPNVKAGRSVNIRNNKNKKKDKDKKDKAIEETLVNNTQITNAKNK